jgi:cytochrome P450
MSWAGATLRRPSKRPARTVAAMIIARHSAVCATLGDPRYAVPEPPAGTATGTLAWLRANVCRFANGDRHARLRALAQADVDRLDPRALRAGARAEASRALAGAGDPVDVMALLARLVPVGALCDALDVPRGAVADVIVVAAAYQPGASEGAQAAADAAVGRLLGLLALPSEAAAARIGVLVQACDATAGLIGNALRCALHAASYDAVDDLISETLRFDPPVRSTRRVDAGETVVLDLAAANRDPAVFADPDRFDPSRGETPHMTFGHGLRPCPGAAHARALAAGVIEAVLDGRRPAAGDVDYEPSANLRVLARLEVTARSPTSAP